MKQFKFSLDIVLKLKENKEEETRIELGRILTRLDKEKLSREDTLRHISGINFVQSSNYQFSYMYRERLMNDIAKIDIKIAELEISYKKAQENYIQAKNQLNAYLKLRDKKEAAYKQQRAKLEMKKLDEMNQFRTSREMSYGR